MTYLTEKCACLAALIAVPLVNACAVCAGEDPGAFLEDAEIQEGLVAFAETIVDGCVFRAERIALVELDHDPREETDASIREYYRKLPEGHIEIGYFGEPREIALPAGHYAAFHPRPSMVRPDELSFDATGFTIPPNRVVVLSVVGQRKGIGIHPGVAAHARAFHFVVEPEERPSAP